MMTTDVEVSVDLIIRVDLRVVGGECSQSHLSVVIQGHHDMAIWVGGASIISSHSGKLSWVGGWYNVPCAIVSRTG